MNGRASLIALEDLLIPKMYTIRHSYTLLESSHA